MKDTGGPAFPHSRLGSDAEGMTLRDYFAAKAMQGMLSNFDWMQHTAENLDMPGEVAVPLIAYELADSMLKARQA